MKDLTDRLKSINDKLNLPTLNDILTHISKKKQPMKPKHEKHIQPALWVIISIVLLVILLCSCSVVDKIEYSHYQYYYKTKAIVVVKKEKQNLYCKSVPGQSCYVIEDHYNRSYVNDTIDLTDPANYWVLENTVRFIKDIK